MSKTTEIARLAEILTRKSAAAGRDVNVSPVLSRLLTIERSLQRMGERRCNEPMSEEEEARLSKREERLEVDAAQLAGSLGASFYHQSDPRGCQVYLLFPGDLRDGQKAESYYTNGVAVCL